MCLMTVYSVAPSTAVTPRTEMSEDLANMLGDISQRDRAQSNRYRGKAAAIEEGLLLHYGDCQCPSYAFRHEFVDRACAELALLMG